MADKVCPFCEELKNAKEIEACYKNSRGSLKNTKTEYKVALITEHYDFQDEPDRCTGVHTGRHMELNFCPVCGKKIER